MPEIEFHSKHAVQRALARLGVRPSKRRGQSFLVSRDAAARIVELAKLERSDTVLEVGPGLGALTAGLLDRAGRVIAVESDGRLASWMRERFSGNAHLARFVGDALGIAMGRLLFDRGQGGARGGAKPVGEVKVVSNIPYSISTPLIIKLLREIPAARLFVITVQKELASRITAAPGSKQYGAFTIFCRMRADVERAFTIPPSAFFPRPEVDSSVVVFKPLGEARAPLDDENGFTVFVQRVFSQRRKMIKTILRRMPGSRCDGGEAARMAESLGIDSRSRPERLSPEQLVRLYEKVAKTI